jgi:hypothetical protein
MERAYVVYKNLGIKEGGTPKDLKQSATEGTEPREETQEPRAIKQTQPPLTYSYLFIKFITSSKVLKQ